MIRTIMVVVTCVGAFFGLVLVAACTLAFPPALPIAVWFWWLLLRHPIRALRSEVREQSTRPIITGHQIGQQPRKKPDSPGPIAVPMVFPSPAERAGDDDWLEEDEDV